MRNYKIAVFHVENVQTKSHVGSVWVAECKEECLIPCIVPFNFRYFYAGHLERGIVARKMVTMFEVSSDYSFHESLR